MQKINTRILNYKNKSKKQKYQIFKWYLPIRFNFEISNKNTITNFVKEKKGIRRVLITGTIVNMKSI